MEKIDVTMECFILESGCAQQKIIGKLIKTVSEDS
jgi:hypothetical protein